MLTAASLYFSVKAGLDYCQQIIDSPFMPSGSYYNPEVPRSEHNIFYNKTSNFLDMVDAAIMNFLIGNEDRKLHYMTEGPMKNEIINLDNGKR